MILALVTNDARENWKGKRAMYYAQIYDTDSPEILAFFSLGGLRNFIEDFNSVPDNPGTVARVGCKEARAAMERRLRAIVSLHPFDAPYHVADLPHMPADELYDHYRWSLEAYPTD